MDRAGSRILPFNGHVADFQILNHTRRVFCKGSALSCEISMGAKKKLSPFPIRCYHLKFRSHRRPFLGRTDRSSFSEPSDPFAEPPMRFRIPSLGWMNMKDFYAHNLWHRSTYSPRGSPNVHASHLFIYTAQSTPCWNGGKAVYLSVLIFSKIHISFSRDKAKPFYCGPRKKRKSGCCLFIYGCSAALYYCSYVP